MKSLSLAFSIASIVLLLDNGAYAQEVTIPHNLDEALIVLAADCPDSLQTIIAGTPDDKLLELCYFYGGSYRTPYDWLNEEGGRSEVTGIFIENGVEKEWNQINALLIAFKRFINDEEINEDEIYERFRAEEKRVREEYERRIVADSIDGVYIPTDLDDCLHQLDLLLSDSGKKELKNLTENVFVGRAHMGVGTWLRNSWRLWAGSRITKYFNELGIYHPDDMSGIVLTSYYRKSNGVAIRLAEQIASYKEFWENAEK